MKLYLKQRIFSWFDSYDIYDGKGETVYIVKGQFSWGHCLHIHDADDVHIGTVQQRILTFLPKFELYIRDEYIGEVRKEVSFLKPRYYLDCRGWQIQGDVFGWDYSVTDEDGELMVKVSKELLHLSDTYEIDIKHEEDMLYGIMIVLAIDAANCK